ncbi:hypothetical protein NE237_011442 [Protea cynaroides]|uniref:Uncharacterized protein n=1 Tax=Protea cynaroides TaxID=273540 RepID=A0A9Q0GW35_9MAGN|nr:hypothetical protein NE237_011442 [Protea cynaroides]
MEASVSHVRAVVCRRLGDLVPPAPVVFMRPHLIKILLVLIFWGIRGGCEDRDGVGALISTPKDSRRRADGKIWTFDGFLVGQNYESIGPSNPSWYPISFQGYL